MLYFKYVDVFVVGTNGATRTPRHFRKTRSTWGYIDCDFGQVGYESVLEQQLALMMIADPQTTMITHQPMQINFRTSDGVRLRRYTPDYLIERKLDQPWVWGDAKTIFERSLLVEVKPSAALLATTQSELERYSSGHEWANKNGSQFAVLTEEFITPLAVQHSQRIVTALDNTIPDWVHRKPVLSEPMDLVSVFNACTSNADQRLMANFLYLGFAMRWFWFPLNVSRSLTMLVYPW